MRTTSDLKTYSAIYDFNVYGGAIGTINLATALPPGFCMAIATAVIIDQPNGGAGTNISFGISGIGTSAVFVAANIAAWASSGVFHCVNPTDGFNFQPPVLTNGGELTFSIFVAPLTAGKIIVSVMGTTFGNGLF